MCAREHGNFRDPGQKKSRKAKEEKNISKSQRAKTFATMSRSDPLSQSHKQQFSKSCFVCVSVTHSTVSSVEVWPLFFFIQEIRQYISQGRYTNVVKLEDNPLEWWKQHGHLFPTMSRIARRYLATPATSAPVERLFSVAGQVNSDRRASLSSDNLTLLVFMYEALPLLRKIRSQESLTVL